MLKSVVLGLGCAAVLAGCSGSSTPQAAPTTSASVSPSPTGPTVLTVEQAGERYLKYICIANAANDKLNESGYGDVYLGQALSAEQIQVLQTYARANAKAAKGLSNPQYAWPDEVTKPVERVAVDLYDLSASAREAAQEGESRVLEDGSLKSATLVRLKLGLPPRGKGCPKG